MELDEEKIKISLKKIYSMIPYFDCKHCHKCCGPIIWFEPEELLIRDFLQKNNIKRVIWTKDEFKKNEMKCPYLSNDKCIIYEVRPIVCRLQGNIPELKCESSNNHKFMTKDSLNDLKKKFFGLIEQSNGLNIFYSTQKIMNYKNGKENW